MVEAQDFVLAYSAGALGLRAHGFRSKIHLGIVSSARSGVSGRHGVHAPQVSSSLVGYHVVSSGDGRSEPSEGQKPLRLILIHFLSSLFPSLPAPFPASANPFPIVSLPAAKPFRCTFHNPVHLHCPTFTRSPRPHCVALLRCLPCCAWCQVRNWHVTEGGGSV